jgi:hypothetical protein
MLIDWQAVIASAGHCPLLYFAWHNKKIQKFNKGIGQWCHRHQIRHTHLQIKKMFCLPFQVFGPIRSSPASWAPSESFS